MISENQTAVLKQDMADCEFMDDQLTKSGLVAKERRILIQVLLSSRNATNCTGKTIINAAQTTRKISKQLLVKNDFFVCWWTCSRHKKSVTQFLDTCRPKLDSL